MRRRQLGWIFTVAMSVAVLLAACAPEGQRAGTTQGQGQSQGTSSGSRLLKLAITVDAEPGDGGIAYGGGAAGGQEPVYLLHAGLTVFDDQGNLQARIAERIPSIESGDWKVAPDGTMELTWKLRPGIQWHDGTPLSAEDFVLGFKVGNDPALFPVATAVLTQIADVTAPDPSTVVMRWKNSFINATNLGLDNLVPLPNHTMGALYAAGDKQAFGNSNLFTDNWIGVGPYKMKEWVRGTHMDLVANDGYFLGRPKIDEVLIKYVGNTQALIVALTSDDVDASPVGSMKPSEAHTLRTLWESQGKGTVIISPNKLRMGKWQFRDPSAWWAGDSRIRQGLTKLIDRQSIVDTILSGISESEDILLARNNPAYKLAQQKSLPNLALDATGAHQLLASAGLTRSADGQYQAQGVLLAPITLSATGDIQTNVDELLAISDAWKQAGFQTTNAIIPTDYSTAQKNEARASNPGVVLTSNDLTYATFQSFIKSQISTEASKWRGSNNGGYSNPQFDQMYDRLFSTLKASDRDPMAADMLKFLLDQVAYLPLEYSPDVAAAGTRVHGMTGDSAYQRVTSWNAQEWT
ncbi:MAG: peptide/nickel transport system substrate-binding protein, partial [Chloroflexota bacterium]|nr:peptide/nickel transport system substrate-binding protein [Chloroflexota bacterium]